MVDKGVEGHCLPTDHIPSRNTDRPKLLHFPVDADRRFQFSRHGQRRPSQDMGKVERISSTSLAFRTDAPLARGSRLSVSVEWPAKMDGSMLHLVFDGVVLPEGGGLVEVTIERPEFQTARGRAVATREEIAAMASVLMNYWLPRACLLAWRQLPAGIGAGREMVAADHADTELRLLSR
jgi:hypothetical protein